LLPTVERIPVRVRLRDDRARAVDGVGDEDAAEVGLPKCPSETSCNVFSGTIPEVLYFAADGSSAGYRVRRRRGPFTPRPMLPTAIRTVRSSG
jgi:hypothetical protein